MKRPLVIFLACLLTLFGRAAAQETPPNWPLFDPSARIVDEATMGNGGKNGRARGFSTGQWRQVGTKDGVPFSLKIGEALTNGLVAGAPDVNPAKMFVGNSWRVLCADDPESGRFGCAVDRTLKLEPHLELKHRGGEWTVCVGQNRYPDTPAQIRVDSNSLHENATENDCFTAQASGPILEEMKAGKRIQAQYMRYPNKTWIPLEITSYGLTEALDMAVWIGKMHH